MNKWRQDYERKVKGSARVQAHCPTYPDEWEQYHIRTGVVCEPSTSRAEKLSDAAAEWVYRRLFSHRRRHRAIGSILRNGLRRPHSEQRRQQRRAGVRRHAGELLESGTDAAEQVCMAKYYCAEQLQHIVACGMRVLGGRSNLRIWSVTTVRHRWRSTQGVRWKFKST